MTRVLFVIHRMTPQREALAEYHVICDVICPYSKGLNTDPCGIPNDNAVWIRSFRTSETAIHSDHLFILADFYLLRPRWRASVGSDARVSCGKQCMCPHNQGIKDPSFLPAGASMSAFCASLFYGSSHGLTFRSEIRSCHR